jgi:hypothetical protein
MPGTAMRGLSAEDRAGIAALLTEFYWRMDHPGSGTVADLFTDDGTIVTPRFEVAGREAIANWFAARPPRITRHSWGNLRITEQPDEVLVEAYLTTAASPATAGSSGAEVMINETRDVVVRYPDNGWRFASRRLTNVFEGRLVTGAGHSS